MISQKSDRFTKTYLRFRGSAAHYETIMLS
jgi:hypothetical protein